MTESNKIISGKKISDEIRKTLESQVALLLEKGIEPCLAVILVGDDPASAVYVRNKQKSCEKIGIKSIVHRLDQNTSQAELLNLVRELNDDSKVHGILCQVPLPKQCNEEEIILAIDPNKDVDCFHPYNVGLLTTGQPKFVPCTPYGVLQILKYSDIATKGKRVAVIGRSNIVGRPLSILLSSKGWDATVTLCHSQTKDLNKVLSSSDIIIAAIGKAEYVNADMIPDNSVIIDVGTNRVEDSSNEKGFRLTGDVNFDECIQKARYITPVPGGVGPMTITMLLYNTINAARSSNQLDLFLL